MTKRRFVEIAALASMLIACAWLVQSRRDLRHEMEARVQEAERFAASALESWELACQAVVFQGLAAKNLDEQRLLAPIADRCLFGPLSPERDAPLTSDDMGGLAADVARAIDNHVLPMLLSAEDASKHPLPHGYQREQ